MIEKETERRIDDGRERLGEGGIPLDLVAPTRDQEQGDIRSSVLGVLRGTNAAVIAEDEAFADGAEPLAQVRVEQALQTLVNLGDSSPEALATVSEHALAADDRRYLRLSLDALTALSPRLGSVMSCLRTYEGPASLRMEALDALSGSDRELASFRAFELTSDQDPNLQSDALIALSALDPEAAAGVAGAILERSGGSDLLRETAFFISCEQSTATGAVPGEPEGSKDIRDCVSMARSAIHGDAPEERLAALSWLESNHPEAALCLMTDRLKDSHPDVRLGALSGLARIDRATARAFAPAVSSDSDERVASLARELSR